MRAELKASGFDVVEVQGTTGVDPRALVEGAVEGARPFATVLILHGGTGTTAEIWVADHLTSKTLVRRVQAEPSSGARAPSALAIHALELLRASLLEVTPGEPAPTLPPAVAPPVPPEVSRWVAEPPPNPASVETKGTTPAETTENPAKEAREERDTAERTQPAAPSAPWPHLVGRWTLEAGGAAFGSPGGLTASAAPMVRAMVGLTPSFGVRLTIVAPAFGPEVRANAGSASVSQELGTVAAAYVVELAPRWLGAIVSLGAGAYHLHVRGTATPPNLAESSDAWAALFDASAGLAFRLLPRVAIIADTHALLAAPRPEVALGNQTTSAGRPILLGSLSALVSFP
jgi:hypothetical protein